MATYEDGYLQALFDVRAEVQQMAHDSSTSSEGKLELLGVLSFVFGLIDAKVAGHSDHGTGVSSNENAVTRDE